MKYSVISAQTPGVKFPAKSFCGVYAQTDASYSIYDGVDEKGVEIKPAGGVSAGDYFSFGDTGIDLVSDSLYLKVYSGKILVTYLLSVGMPSSPVTIGKPPNSLTV